ncbi:MAG: ATP-binding protein [Chloroflexi bacterium]|nr:ATP-binding protein [Chloroflexota bacterium]
MGAQSKTGPFAVNAKGDRRAILALLALALVFQFFLLIEVGIGRPESIPTWFIVSTESFSGVAGISIVYLSFELSRIQQVRYPIIVAVAFGLAAIVSGILVISAAENTVMHQLISSWSIGLSDLFRVGQWVLVVPFAFLPLAVGRGYRSRDRWDMVLVALSVVLALAAGLMVVIDLLATPVPPSGPIGRVHEPRGAAFSLSLTAFCLVATALNTRCFRHTRNRLLLAAAVLLAVIALGQATRAFSIPPLWFWLYFNRVARLAGYTCFVLILLNEYVRGYRRSVALSERANVALERKVQYLNMLTESARSLNSTLDVDRVQKTLLEAAVRLFGAEAAMLAMFDEVTGRLVPTCTLGDPEVFPKEGFPLSRGIGGEVFRTQQAEFVPDVSKDPRAIVRNFGPTRGTVSLLSVPLLIRGRSIGVLNVTSCSWGTERSPGSEEMELLSALASQAAIALENARLFERTAVMHEQLRIAGLRLEAIIDSMPEGVCIAEAPSGKLILANKAAERIIGSTSLTVLSAGERPAALHLTKPNGQMFLPQEMPVVRSICNGEVCRGVEMDVGADLGKKLTILVNSAPIEDTQGNVVGAVTVFQDITRQKQAERMRNDFLSRVSHDLKTPLTTIKGYASTLLQEDVDWTDDEQKQFLRIVAQEADRLTRRVQDLLDASAIASGNFSIKRSWCDVRDLIEVTVERLEDLLVGHNVEVEIVEDLPPIPVDGTRLKQVVSNLIDNAVKFSSEGSEITIRAWSANESLFVSVSDCGVGIDPFDLPRIFDRFSQAHDASMARGPTGKGLGLAICQGIVEAHGGTISADSVEGKGSRFTFSLPAVGPEILFEE